MLLLYLYHYIISVYILNSDFETSLNLLSAHASTHESTWLPATRGHGWYRHVRLGPKLGQISSKWDKSGSFFFFFLNKTLGLRQIVLVKPTRHSLTAWMSELTYIVLDCPEMGQIRDFFTSDFSTFCLADRPHMQWFPKWAKGSHFVCLSRSH